MKQMFKKSCALLTTVALTLSCITFVPFAVSADEGGSTASAERDINISHIEFVSGKTDSNADTVKARAFVRDYSGNTGKVSLLCATYDADNNLVGAGVKTGMNALLSTNAYATAGGTTTKAYVWDATTLAPVTDVATRGAEIIPTITFDGKSFKEYTGQDFDKDKYEYTGINVKDNILTRTRTLPAVRVSLNDKSGRYTVENDSAAMTTTIKIYSGDRTETVSELKSTTPETITNTAQLSKYSRECKTYTIHYDVNKAMFTDETIVESTSNSGGPAVTSFMNRKYTKTVKPEGGESTKTVELTISNWANQNTIMVVQGSVTDCPVVTESGAALTWTEDKSYGGVKEILEDGTKKYNEHSAENAVTYTNDTESKDLKLQRGLMGLDLKSNQTGTKVVTDRNPAVLQKTILSIAPQYEGAYYVALPSAKTSGKICLTIKQECTFTIISTGDNVVLESDGWTKETATSETSPNDLAPQNRTKDGRWTPCYAANQYVDAYRPWTVAWLIKNTDFTPDDFFASHTATAEDFTMKAYDSRDQEISGVESMNGKTIKIYEPKDWKTAYKVADTLAGKQYGPVKFGEGAGLYATVDELLDHWTTISCKDDSWNNAVRNYRFDYAITAGDTGIPAADQKVWPLADTESMYADRDSMSEGTGWPRNNRTGAILNWPGALELEDRTVIRPAVGWVNDCGQYSANYTNSKKSNDKSSYDPEGGFDGEWYSFTAGDEIEVLMLLTGTHLNATDWVEIKIGTDDAMTVVNTLAGTTATLHTYGSAYVRRFDAGETVQIYVPGNSAHMAVYVQHLETDLSNIVELEPKGISDIEVVGTKLDEMNKALRDENGNLILETKKTFSSAGILKVNTDSDETNDTHVHMKNYTDANSEYRAKMGSQIAYDRSYPQTETYPNDLKSVSDEYSFLLGSEYIMSAGEGTNRAANGYETSFRLYRDATVIVFEAGAANASKARELGWEYSESSTPYMVFYLDNLKNATQKMQKHFTVSDKENGDTITIPREMLFTTESLDGDGGTYEYNGKNYYNRPENTTGETLTVIYYD